MFPFPKSRRGVETAPLFIIFAAVVLMMTAALASDIMGRWEKIDSKQRTINEAKRISQTCEEMKFAGDQGSVQELHVDIPQNCQIFVATTSLTASCTFDRTPEIVLTKVKLSSSSKSILAGSSTVRIIYSLAKTPAATKGTYIISVS